MNQEFPPRLRLHHDREYTRVFNRQQKAAGPWTVVLVRPRDPRDHVDARLGIMVSTKVAKRAVRRHQLKRWVRECFRTRLRAALGAHDLVVLLRADPPGDDAHARLDDELLRLVPLALQTKPQPRPGGRRGR